MALPKIKRQRLSFQITANGQQVPIDSETDKLYNTVIGMYALLTDQNAVFSSLQLDINNTEILPEHNEVIAARLKEQAPAGYDYMPLNEPAGGSKIKGTYTDFPLGQSYPYTVVLVFLQENITTTDTGRL